MNKQTFLTRFIFHNQPTTPKFRANEESFNSLKKAAVLIPLVERHNGLHIILTKRAQHLRHHPGQISFPGGKYEQKDASLIQTALRETQEEIGILQEEVTIFGTQPKLPTVSRFVVSPYLGFVKSAHSLKIDTQEVQSIFEVPLNFLANKNNYYLHHFTGNKKRRYSYCIPYQNQLVWGATAQMLKNLQIQLTG